MGTKCKYAKERYMPVNHVSGFSYTAGCLNLILLKRGYLSFYDGHSRVYLNGPSLICLLGEEDIVTGPADGEIVSISFAPSFMNVHLNYALIKSDDYPAIATEHLFPDFKIFLHRSEAYAGVLPLGELSLNRFCVLFDRINLQLKEQPTIKWSCKARSELFLALDIAGFNLDLLENGRTDISELLEEIHTRIDTNLSLLGLFKQYGTTAPTVSRKFKRFCGGTAIGYVLDLRLRLCSYVLAFTDIIVNDIAESYEFNDSTYFARMFKRKYKETPHDFRTQKRIARDYKLRTNKMA